MRDRFGALERREGFAEAVGQPETLRETNIGATRYRRFAFGQRTSLRPYFERCCDLSGFEQHLAAPRQEFGLEGSLFRQRDGPLIERDGGVVVIDRPLALRCLVIGLCGTGVLRLVEMAGSDKTVALPVPLRRFDMQRPAPRLWQGAVGRIAHQCMDEFKMLGARPDQEGIDQRLYRNAARLSQMIDLILGEALAKDRRGLDDAPVGLAQAIETRDDQALDRLRKRFAASSRLVMEKLHQEQRIAGGARQDVLDESALALEHLFGDLPRVLFGKRRKIECGERRGRDPHPPGRIDRITFRARREDQHHRMRKCCLRQRRQDIKPILIDPVQILDGDEERSLAGSMAGELHRRSARAAPGPRGRARRSRRCARRSGAAPPDPAG